MLTILVDQLNSKLIQTLGTNQTKNNYSSTVPPIVIDKISTRENGSASYQLIPQHDSFNSNVTIDPNKNNTSSSTSSVLKDSLKIVDKEYPSPIDGVDFFNTERPINMSMYNETIVSTCAIFKTLFLLVMLSLGSPRLL